MARKSTKRHLVEWAAVILLAICGPLLIKAFAVEVFRIPSGSMAPTLQVGDTIIVDKFSYRINKPKVGDIVVYYKDGTGFIKRLVADEGQEIFFEGDKVFRDGVLVDEPYLVESTPTRGERCTREEPCLVPQGKVFVMGDNRTNSQDSRAAEVGYIEQDAIVGRALAVLYPFNRLGGL